MSIFNNQFIWKLGKKAYKTPGGQYYDIFQDMLDQTHLLIAGSTGSGKSVLINGLITTALLQSPAKYEFIFIDLKRVELNEYRHLPHTGMYADDIDSAIKALEFTLKVIENRYQEMQRKHLKFYQGSAVYLVIDELADLMTTDKKHVKPLLQRIAQIGRAANVHIIAATQCPLSTVIPTEIKVNFDSRVGLRTRSAQDSRNILGFSGCEQLPQYGQGFYMKPGETQLYNIPTYSIFDKQRLINWWMSKECYA